MSNKTEALIVNPQADADVIGNAISEKLAQVESMAFVMCGEDGDFRRWNETIQDNYMWGLQRLISQIRALHGSQM